MLDERSRFFYEYPMDRVIEKIANPNWFYRIIILAIAALTIHIRYLSALMGK